MNNIDLDGFIKNIAEYVGFDESEVTRETDLYSDLLIDSLGLFSMGIYLTGIYHLQVPLSKVAVISKVGDLYDLINNEGTALSENQ